MTAPLVNNLITPSVVSPFANQPSPSLRIDRQTPSSLLNPQTSPQFAGRFSSHPKKLDILLDDYLQMWLEPDDFLALDIKA